MCLLYTAIAFLSPGVAKIGPRSVVHNPTRRAALATASQRPNVSREFIPAPGALYDVARRAHAADGL